MSGQISTKRWRDRISVRSFPVHILQDEFPEEDIVWGEFIYFRDFIVNAYLGIAYTIDPEHAKEVREYLG